MKDETQKPPQGPAKAGDAFDALVEDINSPLFTVKLENGRSVWVRDVHVRNTYGGLLEGIPTEETLNWTTEGLAKSLPKIFGNFPVHILTSEIRRAQKVMPHWPGGVCKAAVYPSFQIAAFFTSSSIGKKKHLSGLIVAWHQLDWAKIPDEDAERKLKALSWDSLALDFDI